MDNQVIDERLQLWTKSDWNEHVENLKNLRKNAIKDKEAESKSKGSNEVAEIVDDTADVDIPCIDISLTVRSILATMMS